MPWTCYKCNKTFAKDNQSHICEVIEIDSLFEKKAPKVKETYEKLLSSLEGIGNFSITATRKTITLYTEGSRVFFMIQPKRQWIDIWFLLDKEMQEFPIFKVVQPSKHRFAHFIRLESVEDAEMLPLRLIQQSYQLLNAP